METKVPFHAIALWTLAIVLGVATMSLAVLAAWVADRSLMALPHWIYPMFPIATTITAGIVAIVAAIRRRQRRRPADGRG